MIEYCERLTHSLKQTNETLLKQSWRGSIEAFITHSVWPHIERGSTPNNSSSMNHVASSLSTSISGTHTIFKPTLCSRIEQRIGDLKERRKRMVKIAYKKEGRLSDFEHGFKTLLARKSQIVNKFTGA